MKRNVKKTKLNQKQNAEKIHAQRRFKQRFGTELSDSDYSKIIKSIRDNRYKYVGELKCVGKQSLRVSLWKGTINGVNVKMVYDNIRHRVITFMPTTFKVENI